MQHHEDQTTVHTIKKVVIKKEAPAKAKPESPQVGTIDKTPKKFNASNTGALKKISFEQLPGWEEAEVKKSLFAFQKSCITFLKQKPTRQVGSSQIDLQAGDWRPACQAALSIDTISEDAARVFFEKWFSPIKLDHKKKSQGLFTGYYMPQFEGSLTRTEHFNTPIYGLPKKLHSSSGNYYTREEIDKGVLKEKAPVIAWINSPVERLFLEIEGSGVIKLTNGKDIYLGYAGENGAPYTSIGSVLIKSGVMTRHNASKNAIKNYLENHPEKVNSILHKNKSFVFFQSLDKHMGLGAKDTALTPGYSLAVDHKYIPFGAPLWLATKKPNAEKFHRLMIAQDTGGAIRGLMRGDIYWGSGKTAAFLGENMKNKGRYWMLIPKFALSRLAMKFGVKS
ncbi:MAG: MltA domain-containing protein [Legionella sp.]|jgi:membrane-bound lytic murein transglycosylase A